MNRVAVKYGVEPIYLKNKNGSRTLSAYIASKCFVLESSDKHIVLFPYAVSGKTFELHPIRTPENAIIGFNTNVVDKVYDTYSEAKNSAIEMNEKLNISTDTNEYTFIRYVQRAVTEKTRKLGKSYFYTNSK